MIILFAFVLQQNRKGSGQDHDRKLEDDDETSSGSLSPQSGQQEDEDIVDDMMMDTEEEERRGAVKTTTETAASFSLEGQLEKKEKEVRVLSPQTLLSLQHLYNICLQ